MRNFSVLYTLIVPVPEGSPGVGWEWRCDGAGHSRGDSYGPVVGVDVGVGHGTGADGCPRNDGGGRPMSGHSE